MRFCKAKKEKPATVTIGENDIVEACYQYLISKGHDLNGRCMVCVQHRTVDKIGRKRRGKIELAFELK